MPISPYFAGQLLKFARLVVNDYRESISRQYPPASKKGQFPARRTGNLRRSTVVRPRSVAEVAATGQVKVGFLQRAWYGVVLEYEMDRVGLNASVEKILRTRVKGGALPKGVTWTRNRETL